MSTTQYRTDSNRGRPSLRGGYELIAVEEGDQYGEETAAVRMVLGLPKDAAGAGAGYVSDHTPLVIVGYDQYRLVDMLRSRRRDPENSLRPIAVVGVADRPGSPDLGALADVVVSAGSGRAAFLDMSEHLANLAASLERLSPAHDDRPLLMLQYFLSRQAKLSPALDPGSLLAYRYPAAEHILQTDTMEVLDVLADMEEHGLLTGSPVDRLFVCPQCGSYRVPVKELCPSCRSPNTTLQDSIHHFRCGYVGPESEFLGGGRPVCPKCQTVLQHIGVEYNRPGRIVTCEECGHWASEPELQAWCVECDAYFAPEQLKTMRIRRFALTGDAAAAARSGQWSPRRARAAASVGEEPSVQWDSLEGGTDEIRLMLSIALENHWPIAIFKADVLMPVGGTLSPDEQQRAARETGSRLKQALGARDLVVSTSPGTYLIVTAKDRRNRSPAAQDLEKQLDVGSAVRIQVAELIPSAALKLLAERG